MRNKRLNIIILVLISILSFVILFSPFSSIEASYESSLVYSSYFGGSDNDHGLCIIQDSEGNIVDSIWARWIRDTPGELVANFPSDTGLAIYFDCGRKDKWGNFPAATAFADSLVQDHGTFLGFG